MSTGRPKRWTGITQRVRSRERRLDDLRGDQRGLRVDVDEATGVAPTALTASAVAMKL